MKKVLSLALIALFLPLGTAKAATLDISLSGPTITYNYNASQDLAASNIDLTNHTPGLNLIDNSYIVPAGFSLANYATSPTGITGANYLAVLGLTPNLKHEDKGKTAFTLAPGNDHLGFTWGTVDDYNTLTILSKGKKYIITGADILANLAGSIAGSTQVDVEINDLSGNIHKVFFTSTGNTFEVGNLTEMDTPATPLPPAMLLFASGLTGLFLFAYRRNLAKA